MRTFIANILAAIALSGFSAGIAASSEQNSVAENKQNLVGVDAELENRALEAIVTEFTDGKYYNEWKTKLAHFSATYPIVGTLCLKMLADKDASLSLKRILLKTLAQDVVFLNLTEDVRQEYSIPADYEAVTWLLRKDGWDKVSANAFYSDDQEQMNNEGSAQIQQDAKTQAKRDPGVAIFVTDGLSDYETDPFSALIHEISHARLKSFLDKYAAKLAKKLPACFANYNPKTNIASFNMDFASFITERLAFETQYQAVLLEPDLVPEKAKYRDKPWNAYYRFRGWKPNIARIKIANYVAKTYNITDPNVLALRDFSIGQILLGQVGEEPCNH